MTIQTEASVHPKTLTEFSQGHHKRTRSYGRRREQVTTTTTRVDPRVWKIALERCDGDPRRIEVVSETHVEIHNDPDWRRSDT
jgi:hypothetical protein